MIRMIALATAAAKEIVAARRDRQLADLRSRYDDLVEQIEACSEHARLVELELDESRLETARWRARWLDAIRGDAEQLDANPYCSSLCGGDPPCQC